MFVDSAYDFSVVKQFFDKFFLPFFKDITLYDDFAGNHPVVSLYSINSISMQGSMIYAKVKQCFKLQTLLQNKMTGLGCNDWRTFSQEFKDHDTSYVLTAVMVHSEIFADSRNATIKNARIAAARRALDKLEKMGIDAFYKICNCEKIRDEARIEMEKIKEKHKEYRKLKKKGFLQNGDEDLVENKDHPNGAERDNYAEDAAIIPNRMEDRFIDLDLNTKKGLVAPTDATISIESSGVRKGESVKDSIHEMGKSLQNLTIRSDAVDDGDESLMSFD